MSKFSVTVSLVPGLDVGVIRNIIVVIADKTVSSFALYRHIHKHKKCRLNPDSTWLVSTRSMRRDECVELCLFQHGRQKSVFACESVVVCALTYTNPTYSVKLNKCIV